MGFDIEKFENANFKDRIETVPVPRLKRFFKLKKGEEPVWIIRGLTGFESALARQEVSENQSAKIQKILEAIGSKLPKTVADAVKAMAIEDEEDVPDDLVQRYLWLERCSVDPVCSDCVPVGLLC